MRADLFTHPKVFKMAALLGKDELHVVGALLAFWAWAHSHAVDGRVDGATSHLVDRATRVDGLSASLVAVGWLIVDADGVTIPRFDVHNGDSAKERNLKNERQSRWRERKKSGLVDDKASTPPSTKASTREEKRREEYSVTNVTGGDAAKPADELTKDELWSAGKSLLSAVMPEKQCGSFVGKLVKDYGDQIVVDAVRAAVVTRPADPIEYLKATCQRAAGQRQPVNKQEALEQRNRQIAAEWAAEGA